MNISAFLAWTVIQSHFCFWDIHEYLLWMHSYISLILFLNQLEMEDGDEIDAMLHQTGGMLMF